MWGSSNSAESELNRSGSEVQTDLKKKKDLCGVGYEWDLKKKLKSSILDSIELIQMEEKPKWDSSSKKAISF